MNKREGSLFTTWLVFFVFSIFLFILCIDEMGFIIKGERIDVNEAVLSGEEIKIGDNVSIEVQYIIDWYAELTQTGRRTGLNVTYHCLVMLDDGRIISMSVKQNSNEYRLVENLIDYTYDYIMGYSTIEPTPIKFTGKIRNIDSEISDYYKSSLSMLGYSSGDYINLEIDTQQKRIYSVLMFVFSIIIFAITILFAYFEIKNRKEKKAERMRELNSPINVTKPENDPIFNKAFYDRMDTFKTDSNSDVAIDENNSDTDNNEYIEDEIANKPITSKFSLKKDD